MTRILWLQIEQENLSRITSEYDAHVEPNEMKTIRFSYDMITTLHGPRFTLEAIRVDAMNMRSE